MWDKIIIVKGGVVHVQKVKIDSIKGKYNEIKMQKG